jgi:EamA domain-containing membrane protein RarD
MNKLTKTCIAISCLCGGFFILFFGFAGLPKISQLCAYKGIMCLPILFASLFIKDMPVIHLRAILKLKNILMCAAINLALLINWLCHQHIIGIKDNLFIDGFAIIMVTAIAVILLNQLPSMRKRLAIAMIFSALLYLVFSLKVVPWLPMWLALIFFSYRLIAKILPLQLSICLAIENLCIFPIVIFYLYQFYKASSSLLIIHDTAKLLLLLTLGMFAALGLACLNLKTCKTQNPFIKWLQLICPASQFLIALFIFQNQCATIYLISCALIFISFLLYFLPIEKIKWWLSHGWLKF